MFASKCCRRARYSPSLIGFGRGFDGKIRQNDCAAAFLVIIDECKSCNYLIMTSLTE